MKQIKIEINQMHRKKKNVNKEIGYLEPRNGMSVCWDKNCA